MPGNAHTINRFTCYARVELVATAPRIHIVAGVVVGRGLATAATCLSYGL